MGHYRSRLIGMQRYATISCGNIEAVDGQKPSAPDWSKLIKEKQDEIAAWAYLPDGGLLVLYNMDRLAEEEYGPHEGDPFFNRGTVL